jgi:hypothetical protein
MKSPSSEERDMAAEEADWWTDHELEWESIIETALEYWARGEATE